jgi:hypothetical protein
MAITSTAGAGITVTTAAVSDTLGTAGTTTTITFTDTFTNLNNGNTGTSSYAGRLAILRPGTATEEVRYISSEITTTQVEVSEPFEVAPASSDVVDVSYIIEDAATVNGLSLINKRTNDYSSSRRMTIGSAGFFALLDGASLETVGNGSTTQADIIVQGVFYNGYLNAGQTVAGGSIFGAGGAGTADADLVFDCNAGGEVYMYDMLMKSVNVYAQEYDGSGDFQRVKFFSSNHTLRLSGPNELRDCIIEGVGGAGIETVEVDSNTVIDGLNLVATSGFITADDNIAEELTVKNCRFINNSRIVFVNNDKDWNFVNPTWAIDTGTQEQIQFEGNTGDFVKESYTFVSDISDASANPVSGASYIIFESGRTQASQYFGFSNVSGDYDIDIEKDRYTYNTATTLSSQTNFGHFLKVYDYGFQPALLPLTVNQALSVPITLSSDVAVTNASQSGAVVAGSPKILRKAGVVPHRVIHYDGGTGGLPTIGEEVGVGVSSSTILDYEGDATEGILVLDDDYITPIGNNDVLNGSIGTFSALADTAGGVDSLDLDFEYIIDCSGLPLDDTYDAWTAQLSNPRSAFCILDDGGTLTDFNFEAQKGIDSQQEEVDLFPDGGSAVNDAFYVGSFTPFSKVLFWVSRNNFGGFDTPVWVWEYYNGTGWSSLTTTQTPTFQNVLTDIGNVLEFNVPSNWAPQGDLAGNPYDLFYIRMRITTGNLSEAPDANYVVIEPDFLSVIEDGANQWANPFTNVGGSYQTVRTTFNNLNHGFWLMNRGTGSVSFMTDDNGTTYTPPVQYTFTLTGLVTDSEVRVYTDDGNRTELAGTDSSTGTFNYSYQYGGSDVDIYVVVHHIDYEYIRLEGLALSNANQSIPIQQRSDRNYDNPEG